MAGLDCSHAEQELPSPVPIRVYDRTLIIAVAFSAAQAIVGWCSYFLLRTPR